MGREERPGLQKKTKCTRQKEKVCQERKTETQSRMQPAFLNIIIIIIISKIKWLNFFSFFT